MKILILEMTAEEMRANKRVADDIADALSTMINNIVRIRPSAIPNSDIEEDSEEGDEE